MKSLTEAYLTQIANRQVSESETLSEAPLGPGIVRPAHQEYTAWTKGDAYQLGFAHGKAGKKFKAPKKFGNNNQLHMAYRNGFKAGNHGHQTEEVSLTEGEFESKMHKSKANWHELSVNSHTKPSKKDQDHLAAAMYHNRRAAGLPMTAWDHDFEKARPHMVSYHIPTGKK